MTTCSPCCPSRKAGRPAFRFHLGVFWYRNAGKDRFEDVRPLVHLYRQDGGVSAIDWDHYVLLDLLRPSET